MAELADPVAGLATALPPESEQAERFDLLILQLQLAHLNGAVPACDILAAKVRGVANHLEDYLGVPAVAAQAAYIAEIQGDE